MNVVRRKKARGMKCCPSMIKCVSLACVNRWNSKVDLAKLIPEDISSFVFFIAEKQTTLVETISFFLLLNQYV